MACGVFRLGRYLRVNLIERALAAIAAEPFRDGKRVLQPGKREIVNDNFPYRLENLELMPLTILGPECHRGFERRTARKAAGGFCNQNGRGFGERKSRAR